VSAGDGIRPLLFTARDVARYLGIGRTTLYQLIKAGEVTSVHIGRCVRFSMHELEAYVERLMGVAPTPPPQPAERPHPPTRRRASRTSVSAPTLF
jgi:excisionase family DNA binding protein